MSFVNFHECHRSESTFSLLLYDGIYCNNINLLMEPFADVDVFFSFFLQQYQSQKTTKKINKPGLINEPDVTGGS